jgi:hypothetical protein
MAARRSPGPKSLLVRFGQPCEKSAKRTLGLYIFIRVFFESLFALFRTEMVTSSLVSELMIRGHRIHSHSANRIYCCFMGLLSHMNPSMPKKYSGTSSPLSSGASEVLSESFDLFVGGLVSATLWHYIKLIHLPLNFKAISRNFLFIPSPSIIPIICCISTRKSKDRQTLA